MADLDAGAMGHQAMSYDTVKHLVRSMVTQGDLDTDGSGYYFIPLGHSPHTPFTATREDADDQDPDT